VATWTTQLDFSELNFECFLVSSSSLLVVVLLDTLVFSFSFELEVVYLKHYVPYQKHLILIITGLMWPGFQNYALYVFSKMLAFMMLNY